MALTSKDAASLGSNPVTDVNGNVAIGNPDAVKHISPEAALLFNKAIIAKPLMAPEVCSLHIKNTEYRYRWVNRDGLGGRIYTQRRAQGFLNATMADVDILNADAQTKDGEIRAGDLVLMKIRADLYDGAIKANMLKAKAYADARGVYAEGGSSDVNSDAVMTRRTVAADPGSRTGLASAFIPTNADSIINESISSGRAEATREVVEGLRASGKEAKK